MPIRSSPPIRSLATANETLRRLVDPPPLIWQILPIWQRVRLVDESWVQKLYDNPPALESTKAVKRVIPLIEKLDREAHKQGQKGTCAPGILSALNSINLASRQDLQLVRDANQEFRTLLVKEKENRRRLKWFAENQQYRYELPPIPWTLQ